MKHLRLLTGILLACATSAFAQSDGPEPDELFKKLDRNGDGKLVSDEIPEAQSRFFQRLIRLGDADDNGELTQAEFGKATSETADTPSPAQIGSPAGRRPGGQADAKQFFERMDQNGDGKLTRSELPEFLAERLGRASRPRRPSGWLRRMPSRS